MATDLKNWEPDTSKYKARLRKAAESMGLDSIKMDYRLPEDRFSEVIPEVRIDFDATKEAQKFGSGAEGKIYRQLAPIMSKLAPHVKSAFQKEDGVLENVDAPYYGVRISLYDVKRETLKDGLELATQAIEAVAAERTTPDAREIQANSVDVQHGKGRSGTAKEGK